MAIKLSINGLSIEFDQFTDMKYNRTFAESLETGAEIGIPFSDDSKLRFNWNISSIVDDEGMDTLNSIYEEFDALKRNLTLNTQLKLTDTNKQIQEKIVTRVPYSSVTTIDGYNYYHARFNVWFTKAPEYEWIGAYRIATMTFTEIVDNPMSLTLIRGINTLTFDSLSTMKYIRSLGSGSNEDKYTVINETSPLTRYNWDITVICNKEQAAMIGGMYQDYDTYRRNFTLSNQLKFIDKVQRVQENSASSLRTKTIGSDEITSGNYKSFYAEFYVAFGKAPEFTWDGRFNTVSFSLVELGGNQNISSAPGIYLSIDSLTLDLKHTSSMSSQRSIIEPHPGLEYSIYGTPIGDGSLFGSRYMWTISTIINNEQMGLLSDIFESFNSKRIAFTYTNQLKLRDTIIVLPSDPTEFNVWFTKPPEFEWESPGFKKVTFTVVEVKYG